MSPALAVPLSSALAAPKRRAVLLVNVGTPDGPDTASVRRYLREFLSDPRVLDMNPVGRWLLLNAVILPFRPAKSAHAYQSVWTKAGSPLLVHSLAQRDGLAARLPGVKVLLAMRYGNPSLEAAVRALRDDGVGEVLVAPLFPQYASATTGTALEAGFGALGRLPAVPQVKTLAPFHADAGFLDAWAQTLKAALAGKDVQHVVFSYHGLPERQVRATDQSGAHCLAGAACCDALGEKNHACYRAQCFATSRAIAERLGLASVSTSFQSRLGRVPWIGPHSHVHVPELARRGLKRVLVACPSFVADCLETLEEIGQRLAQDFKAAGGEELTVAPCLNDSPRWLDALADLCRRQLDA